MNLYQYASSVRSTKGYHILYESQDMVIATSDLDPSIIITTKKRNSIELEHVRIKKDVINNPSKYRLEKRFEKIITW